MGDVDIIHFFLAVGLILGVILATGLALALGLVVLTRLEGLPRPRKPLHQP